MDPRRLFRPTASHKAGPLIKTTPLLSHHSPLLANQEGLASKMEAAMGERAGLDRRTSHCTQQSGCECEFYVKFKFPQRSITWLPLSPCSYSVSRYRSASCPMHLTCPFHPFRSNSPIQIRQSMCVLARECFQGFGRELGMPDDLSLGNVHSVCGVFFFLTLAEPTPPLFEEQNEWLRTSNS